MFGLAQILPPSQLLQIVASEIEKQLFVDVKKFDIYLKTDKELAFKVAGEMYAFDDSTIKDGIKSLAENHIPKDVSLDMVVVHWSADDLSQCFADLYYTDKEGEKIHEIFKY